MPVRRTPIVALTLTAAAGFTLALLAGGRPISTPAFFEAPGPTPTVALSYRRATESRPAGTVTSSLAAPTISIRTRCFFATRCR